MSCKTPVAFIIFRRPDLTARVFEVIRQVRPEKLFVIADGPRNPEEAETCRATRAVTEQVDWPCEVIREYSEENMGARRRISSGLDRVFGQVDEAIILEDDCLPHPSFFPYCEELLERYRTDTRIGSISGDNLQRGQIRGDASYYFSHYFHGWGWATWSRAWQHYDHEMAGWPAFRDRKGLHEMMDDAQEADCWQKFFESFYKLGRPDAWDYIWLLSCWMNRLLTIIPNVNLVANIGFGAAATNTTGTGSWIATRPAEAIGRLIHPQVVQRDRAADQFTFEHAFSGGRMRKELCWKYRLRKRLWRLKQKVPGAASA